MLKEVSPFQGSFSVNGSSPGLREYAYPGLKNVAPLGLRNRVPVGALRYIDRKRLCIYRMPERMEVDSEWPQATFRLFEWDLNYA